MFRFLRETWETLRALAAMVRQFFVKWFLPLHSDGEDDDDEPREIAWFDDEARPEETQEVADTAPRQIEDSGAFPSPPADGGHSPEETAVAAKEPPSDGDDLQEEDTAADVPEQADDAHRD